MNYKKNCFLLTLFLLFGFMAKSQDYELIRGSAKTSFLIGSGEEDLEDYTNLLGELNAATGMFTTDVDYTNDVPIKHLQKLAVLSQGWARKNDNDPLVSDLDLAVLGQKILAGLDWWFDDKLYTDPTGFPAYDPLNWFKYEIAPQRETQKISVLFYPVLDMMVNHGLRDRINIDFPLNIDDDFDPEDPYSGANKADIAGSIIAKGLLLDDEDNEGYVNEGKVFLECVMSFATNNEPGGYHFDGIREDYSFNQHNKKDSNGDRRAFLYDGDYGLSAIHNIALWGAAFDGDQGYDYLPTPKSNFLSYVMDGYRWMTIGNTTDYSANGRKIARQYPNNNAAIPAEDITNLMTMAPNLASAINEMGMKMAPGNYSDNKQSFINPQTSASQHHKYFWKSDYVCHQEDGYFSSLRMCSDRTLGTEYISGENKLGFWLPYGCTFIYKDGDEYIRLMTGGDVENPDGYDNVFPFWNWSYVPGVTCPVLPDGDLNPSSSNDWDSNPNTQVEKFVGNASNDKYGVSTMSFNKAYTGGTVSAKKAWFHFGEEVIALGTGITGTGLHTTINQCLLTGGVTSTNEYIEHDGIAYIFPDDPVYFPNGQDPQASEDQALADWDWSRIDDCGSDCEAFGSRDVFRAWINHTGNNANSYYYIIAPGQDAANYVVNNPVTLIKNDNSSGSYIQAVKKVEGNGDVLAGVIYYPHPVDPTLFAETFVPITGNIELSTDKPCALLYDGSIGQVCISSPDRMQSNIMLTIQTDNGTASWPFYLPTTDEEAGKSICRNIYGLAGTITNPCFEDQDFGGYEEGVEGAQIYVNGASTGTSTDVNGAYSASGLIGGNSYELDPEKDIEYLDGVNVKDLVAIRNHYEQSELLDTPYKRIAADVNKTGTITGDDYRTVKALILGDILAFEDVDSWEFVTADYVFPNEPDPFGTSADWLFTQSINESNLGGIIFDADFIGIKMGDVFCSRYLRDEPDDPRTPKIKIIIEDRSVVEGEIVNVSFKVENFSEIEAYQLGIEFNSEVLEQQSINSGDLNRANESENFGLNEVMDGNLKSVWLYNEGDDPNITAVDTSLVDSSALFIVEFKALTDYTRSSSSSNKLSDLIDLNDDVLANKAYGSKGMYNIELIFVPEESFGESASILLSPIKCFPNPAQTEINFDLNLRRESNIHLQIFDPVGSLVTEQEMTLPRGSQLIDIDNLKNWERGMYYYVIRIENEIEAGKFIKL